MYQLDMLNIALKKFASKIAFAGKGTSPINISTTHSATSKILEDLLILGKL